MRITVSTPLRLVVDADDVSYVRAEDLSGLFGLLPGHRDLLTVLAASVLSWRDGEDEEHYVAVNGGVLALRDDHVAVATREAVLGEDLHHLEDQVLRHFREEAEAESEARAQSARLQAAALRRIAEGLRPPSTRVRRTPVGEEEA